MDPHADVLPIEPSLLDLPFSLYISFLLFNWHTKIGNGFVSVSCYVIVNLFASKESKYPSSNNIENSKDRPIIFKTTVMLVFRKTLKTCWKPSQIQNICGHKLQDTTIKIARNTMTSVLNHISR